MCVWGAGGGGGGWRTRVGGGGVWECSPAGVLVSEQRKKEPPRDSAKQNSFCYAALEKNPQFKGRGGCRKRIQFCLLPSIV